MHKLKMTNRENLRCDLTRIVDNSPCGYEIVIAELRRQIVWMIKDRKANFPEAPRYSRQQLMKDLRLLSERGALE